MKLLVILFIVKLYAQINIFFLILFRLLHYYNKKVFKVRQTLQALSGEASNRTRTPPHTPEFVMACE